MRSGVVYLCPLGYHPSVVINIWVGLIVQNNTHRYLCNSLADLEGVTEG
jgi:hypothetical protein